MSSKFGTSGPRSTVRGQPVPLSREQRLRELVRSTDVTGVRRCDDQWRGIALVHRRETAAVVGVGCRRHVDPGSVTPIGVASGWTRRRRELVGPVGAAPEQPLGDDEPCSSTPQHEDDDGQQRRDDRVHPQRPFHVRQRRGCPRRSPGWRPRRSPMSVRRRARGRRRGRTGSAPAPPAPSPDLRPRLITASCPDSWLVSHVRMTS